MDKESAILVNFQIRLEILKCRRDRALLLNSPWIISTVEDELKELSKELVETFRK